MSNFWQIAVSVAGLGAIGAYVFWSLIRFIWTKTQGHPLNQKQTYTVTLVSLVIVLLALFAILWVYYLTHPSKVAEVAMMAEMRAKMDLQRERTQQVEQEQSEDRSMVSDVRTEASVLLEKLIQANPQIGNDENSKNLTDLKQTLEKLRKHRVILPPGLIAAALRSPADFGAWIRERQTLLAQAHQLHNEGKNEMALTIYDKVIAYSANTDYDAYQRRGWALKDMRRFDEAIQAFHDVNTLRPDASVGYFGIATVYVQLAEETKDQEKLRLALPEIDRAIALEPSNPDFLGTRGHIRHQLGESAEARADFLGAVRILTGWIDRDPNAAESAEHYQIRGQIYEQLGEVEKAREDKMNEERIRSKN